MSDVTSAQNDYSNELPRIPPTPPEQALETFRVADGFAMQQVASEPLVTSPVAVEWAADGSLFVCEMRGYSEDRDEAISRITRLTDEDADGVFDSSAVFADGLLWPTALFPWDGGLFVGDAPHLYYFKDTDGDGKADHKKIVLTGFGTSNVQGLFNSFRWDLDNRIHIACSSVGGQVRRPDQSEDQAKNVRGRDLAFDPRTGAFELTSGAAQHGMCFDDWGRKFVSSNSDHLQQVMYEERYIARNAYLRPAPARISIAQDGPQAEVFRASPVEPWRIVRTRLRVSGKARGPIEGGGRAAGYFTGATGVTIYRGDAWPRQWDGLAIIGDVGSNLVHRKRLIRDGLKMIGKRIDPESEFVASTDIWFRPAQFANAPDGSLHIIDVCREVIEHPKSLPPEIKQHLDLTAGRNRGRLYRLVQDGFEHRPTPNLNQADDTTLVKMLEHPNAWHRETAARLIYQRRANVGDELRKMANESSSAVGRMHSLYALDGLGQLDASTLLACLKDDHAQVRRHAVRLSERVPESQALTNALETLANDPSLEVRYQLAFTAGSITSFPKTDVLAAIIKQTPDNRWLQTAVQSSVSEGVGALFAALVRDADFRSEAAGEFLERLAAQISQQNRESEIRQALAVFPELPEEDASFALPIVGRLLESRSREKSVLARISEKGELEAVDQKLQRMLILFAKRAGNEDAPVNRRVAAIEGLQFADVSLAAETLAPLIDNREPATVQRAAMTTLGKFATDDVTQPLLEQWRGLSPSLRETASEVLFARPDRLRRLLDAVDAGEIPVSELSRSRLQAAAKSRDPDLRKRIQRYLDASGSKQRAEVVKAYQKSLDMSGDIQRGRKHFVKHCAACHRVEGTGHEIGPNLATIKSRGPETILVNVLDPNREVNPQYLNYVVLTLDGRTVSGMIAAENASGLTLQRAEAEKDDVLRVDIDRLQSTGLSIMPEGFEEQLDPQAMADLIAYLMQVE